MMIRGTTNDGRTPPRKLFRGNLSPAPFAITPSVVARVLALAARPVARAVLVPLSPVKLVDRPRRSQDPRLAKVNDDQAEQSSFSRLPLQEYGRKRMADGGGVSLNPQALVDRGEASPHTIQQSTTTDRQTADHAGGCEGRAAEVTSGAVDGGPVSPANARQPHNTANLTLPTTPPHLRMERLHSATAFLKARCVLVMVVNRDALVREYRVSGKRYAMLAEDVIKFAQSLGMA